MSPLQARLSGYRLPDGSQHALTSPLEATATLDIYPPLAVVPELVVLPWNPQTAPTYNIQLNVSTDADAPVQAIQSLHRCMTANS